MSGVETTARPTDAPSTTGPHITHIARSRTEMPPVALCGYRGSPDDPTYIGWLDEAPLPCVVCLDLRWPGGTTP